MFTYIMTMFQMFSFPSYLVAHKHIFSDGSVAELETTFALASSFRRCDIAENIVVFFVLDCLDQISMNQFMCS